MNTQNYIFIILTVTQAETMRILDIRVERGTEVRQKQTNYRVPQKNAPHVINAYNSLKNGIRKGLFQNPQEVLL